MTNKGIVDFSRNVFGDGFEYAWHNSGSRFYIRDNFANKDIIVVDLHFVVKKTSYYNTRISDIEKIDVSFREKDDDNLLHAKKCGCGSLGDLYGMLLACNKLLSEKKIIPQ